MNRWFIERRRKEGSGRREKNERVFVLLEQLEEIEVNKVLIVVCCFPSLFLSLSRFVFRSFSFSLFFLFYFFLSLSPFSISILCFKSRFFHSGCCWSFFFFFQLLQWLWRLWEWERKGRKKRPGKCFSFTDANCFEYKTFSLKRMCFVSLPLSLSLSGLFCLWTLTFPMILSVCVIFLSIQLSYVPFFLSSWLSFISLSDESKQNSFEPFCCSPFLFHFSNSFLTKSRQCFWNIEAYFFILFLSSFFLSLFLSLKQTLAMVNKKREREGRREGGREREREKERTYKPFKQM